MSKNRKPQLPIAGNSPVTARSSARDKVALFRRLFRGRDDVYPKLWENETRGTRGYAPACHNEWVRGLCDKPRVRCGSCTNQAFVPLTDTVVLDHLRGRHVVGIYPLLRDDTCWLLAIDFDKGSWQEDVSGFAATCRQLDVPVLIERSRSGKGAHVWMFFSAPVPATTARRLGTHLLTETMAQRRAIDLSSYDRMFPNQDTLPRGGFGNLIALPLQLEARRSGNTVFVDDSFAELPDPWIVLSEYHPLEVQRVEELARQTDKTAGAFGSEGALEQPWRRDRSGAVRIAGEVPSHVRAVQRQLLFVEKRGLSTSLLNAMKRLAAFQNPEFFKRQKLRLSLAKTPRIICCAEDLPQHLALPRGCTEALAARLGDVGSALDIVDERERGTPLSIEFQGQLTTTQQRAVDAMLEHDIGVLVAPPGAGKTVMGAYLIAARATSCLVLVHRTQLLEQWVSQLSLFLGIPPTAIGQLGAGKRRPNRTLDIATFASLVRGHDVDAMVEGYGHVLVDECHHVPSASFERVLRNVCARYVTGLTATPKRRDGHEPIGTMQLGPCRFSIDTRHATLPSSSHQVIARRLPTHPSPDESKSPRVPYEQLVSDDERNARIVGDVVAALEAGRAPLVLTERRAHVDRLDALLRRHTANVVVLHGGLKKAARAAAMKRLRGFGDAEERVVLATGRYAGEGFDDPRLDTLFLALPIAWRGTLIQYAGRLHRGHYDKSDVLIIDYVDDGVHVLERMFQKRRRGYRSLGYVVGEADSLGDLPLQLSLRYTQRAKTTPSRQSLMAAEPIRHSPTDEPTSLDLDAMIDDVLVAAFDPQEQAVAFLEMLDDQLQLPFRARAGRTAVTVESLSVDDRARVVAHCSTAQGRLRRIPLTKLTPTEAVPVGWEWAAAYAKWTRGASTTPSGSTPAKCT